MNPYFPALLPQLLMDGTARRAALIRETRRRDLAAEPIEAPQAAASFSVRQAHAPSRQRDDAACGQFLCLSRA